MKTKTVGRHLAVVLVLTALTACAKPPPPKYDISPRARAALPPDQDLSLVRRGTDGCYTYVKDGPLSGYLLDLKDENGVPVCDDPQI